MNLVILVIIFLTGALKQLIPLAQKHQQNLFRLVIEQHTDIS